MEHPDRYTDEQWQELLSDEECRELYEAIRLSASAFEAEDAKQKIANGIKEEEWQKFEAKHFPQKHGSWGWMQMAATFIGVLIVSGIALTAAHFARLDANEECVAYVYGEKTTDRETVMAEMKRSIGEIAEDNPQDNIEQQLNDLFSH